MTAICVSLSYWRSLSQSPFTLSDSTSHTFTQINCCVSTPTAKPRPSSAHQAGKSKQQERAEIPAEPPQFSVSGRGRKNLAAENYCLWILWYLQSVVQNPITSKHTSQFQLSEVLVEADVWLENILSLFQEVKSHLKSATCEPFISLYWTLH